MFIVVCGGVPPRPVKIGVDKRIWLAYTVCDVEGRARKQHQKGTVNMATATVYQQEFLAAVAAGLKDGGGRIECAGGFQEIWTSTCYNGVDITLAYTDQGFNLHFLHHYYIELVDGDGQVLASATIEHKPGEAMVSVYGQAAAIAWLLYSTR